MFFFPPSHLPYLLINYLESSSQRPAKVNVSLSKLQNKENTSSSKPKILQPSLPSSSFPPPSSSLPPSSSIPLPNYSSSSYHPPASSPFPPPPSTFPPPPSSFPPPPSSLPPSSFQRAYENGNLRVESLLSAYDWNYKNNERLEETLRTEILNSEEQRSFIELLKNTLEKKLNAKK